MKKDIWDNVYYRLKDEHEVKLSILYCVKYAEVPVSDTEIKHFMLSATSVSFVDLCINLSSLSEEGFLKTVLRDDIEKYDLTDSGHELIEMFSDKILLSVKENLRKTIDEYLKRESGRLLISATLQPASGDNFNAELTIKNTKDTLMSLSVFAGNRENAIAMRKHFEKNASVILAKIMEISNENVSLEKEGE